MGTSRTLVLLRFNSQANADLFIDNVTNSVQYEALIATVPQGYTPPSRSGSFLSPAPESQQYENTSTFVTVWVPNISVITDMRLQPEYWYNPTTGESWASPNVDPTTITIKNGDNTIIQNGTPPPDWTPPTDPTPPDSPIDFQPIYYIPPQYPPTNFPMDPNEFMNPDLTDLWFIPESIQDSEQVDPVPSSNPNLFNPRAPSFDQQMEIKPPNVDTPMLAPNVQPKGSIVPPFKGEQFNTSGEGGGLSASQQQQSAPFIFVLAVGAVEQILEGGVLTPANLVWSTDGLTWSNCNIALTSAAVGPNIGYFNGSFSAVFSDFNTFNRYFCFSTDGKNFTTEYVSANDVGNLTIDEANNQWVIINLGGPNVTIPIPFPPGTIPSSNTGDDPIEGPLADKSQTAVTDPSFIAINPLPTGWTAMDGHVDHASAAIFSYSTTTITTTVVDSGTDWPLANWQTSFDFGNFGSQDQSSNNILYAPVVTIA